MLNFKTTWSEFQNPCQTAATQGEAELRIYILKGTSPPQSRSQAVVCVSTPRMYPLRVTYNFIVNCGTQCAGIRHYHHRTRLKRLPVLKGCSSLKKHIKKMHLLQLDAYDLAYAVAYIVAYAVAYAFASTFADEVNYADAAVAYVVANTIAYSVAYVVAFLVAYVIAPMVAYLITYAGA